MATTRITRRIEAPRAKVYAALLDAEAVSTWMVPDGMTSQVHLFEPLPGGAFRISLTYASPQPAGKTTAHTDTFHGTFVELVPNERVVQAIEFETDDPDMQGEMTATYVLRDTDDGATILDASHAALPPGISPEDNEAGWRMSLAKLAALVERAPDSPR